MSGPIIKNVNATTADTEKVTRGGEQSSRVYSPINERLLEEILHELRVMNTHLSLITDQEID